MFKPILFLSVFFLLGCNPKSPDKDSVETNRDYFFNPGEEIYIVTKIIIDSTDVNGLEYTTTELKNAKGEPYITEGPNKFDIGDSVLIYIGEESDKMLIFDTDTTRK